MTTQIIAGIMVADTPSVAQAIDYALAHSDAYLFNHCVRSWLFAVRIGQLRDIEHDGEVVAIGCLLHDIGLTKEATGPRRFEVEGADAALSFARDRGFDERRAQLIWDSVALNSTPSIGLFKEAEVSLCTAGIGLDFGGRQYDAILKEEMAGILEAYPRLRMKKRITDCFCCIIEAKPASTYDNFARDFGERFVPDYKPTSVADYLMNSPFEE